MRKENHYTPKGRKLKALVTHVTRKQTLRSVFSWRASSMSKQNPNVITTTQPPFRGNRKTVIILAALDINGNIPTMLKVDVKLYVCIYILLIPPSLNRENLINDLQLQFVYMHDIFAFEWFTAVVQQKAIWGFNLKKMYNKHPIKFSLNWG